MTTPTLYKFIESELFKMGHDHEIVDKEGNLVFFDNAHQVMSKILSYDDDVITVMDNLFLNHKLDNEVYDYHFKKTFFYRFINRQINRQTIEAFKMELISTFMMNQDFINRVYGDMEKYLSQTNTNDQTNRTDTIQDNTQTNTQQNTTQDSRQNKENSTQDNTQDTVQDNTQTVDGSNTSDNRTARADLPQNNVNIDVNDSVMNSANENEISRNKQGSNQNTEGNTTTKNTGSTTGENTGESTGDSMSDTFGETNGKTTGNTEGESNTLAKSYQLDELFKTNGVMESIYNVFDVKCFLQTW